VSFYFVKRKMGFLFLLCHVFWLEYGMREHLHQNQTGKRVSALFISQRPFSFLLVALGTWEIVFYWTLCECGCVLNDEKVGL